MSHIELTNVSKVFPPQSRGGNPLVAVDDVSLRVEKGEIYGIIGHSGAGKSTLVRLLNGLEPATSGSVVVDGTDITKISAAQLRTKRTDIGMIFQHFNLLSSRTVRSNVEYPLEVAGVKRADRKKRALELLEFVGLAHRADAYPHQLSGGQKQRVGIARALAANPATLLADEATSALDPETTSDVLALLRRVNREFGITIVVITHEMEVITSLAHRVAVMAEGRVVEEGDIYDVFTNPQTETAKRFVRTVVDAVPADDELAALRAKHPGKLVAFAFGDDGADQSSIFESLSQAGLKFELVYGGVHDLQGRTYALLTFAIQGDEAHIASALSHVDSRITVTEVA